MKFDVGRKRGAVYALAFVAWLVGIGWGLPGSESWAADAVSPRAAGLFAIVETYRPGHFHVYPPLHTALLTLLSLPVAGYEALRVGVSSTLLEPALIGIGPMTVVEVLARLVALAMFLGIVSAQMRLYERLFDERVGLIAGLVVACNPVLVYYAHTGNLDLPALFWGTLALEALERVLSGAPWERRTVLTMTAAVLTKDQAAGLFVLPLLAVVGAAPRLLSTRRAWTAIGFGALGFSLLSGAIVNPSGFSRRLAFLFGAGSRDWAEYPASLEGRTALVRDAVLAAPRYGSWALAALSLVGLCLAWNGHRGAPLVRRLLPALAALSFTALFSFGASRTDDRFLLPQSILLLPYAGVALDRVRTALPRARAVWAGLLGASFVPALLGVASVDATLLADPRYQAEAFLSALPPATTVEFYGGPHFLPRIPEQIHASRVGEAPIGSRSHLPRLTEAEGAPLDIGLRRPDYVVLSTELTLPPPIPGFDKVRTSGPYSEPEPREFLRALKRGDLGYERVFQARCEVPWPLDCRSVHSSTGLPVWIYRRSVRSDP